MGYREVSNDYLRTQVMSASPIKLIVMLYEGAIKSMKIAKLAIEQKDVPRAHRYLQSAKKIVNELKNSVDTSVEGDIPEHLISLYEYCSNQLAVANLTKDTKPVDTVIHIMTELLSSWEKIAKQD
ncbi:flagellar export chaperone FliS [Liquorilactobacillus sicerae]|uniref:flagellar export chaperone FliS n=1 Tax=Liquorilactobacillus sicerae TaxID=1416943 RepID=UPI00247FE3F2|nr:flagellar export chaperone FliS [Liquorilactobacillus sicerae]